MNTNEPIAEEFDEEVEEVEETQEEPQDNSEDLATKLAEAEKRLATTIAQKKHLQKKLQEGGKKESNDGFSQRDKDVMTLIRANVHDDDIEEVMNWAKYRNISIAEALKSDVIKTTLAQNEEYRRTAEATNTKTTRKGPDRVDERVLMANLKEGKVPTTPEESEALFYARRGGKR